MFHDCDDWEALTVKGQIEHLVQDHGVPRDLAEMLSGTGRLLMELGALESEAAR